MTKVLNVNRTERTESIHCVSFCTNPHLQRASVMTPLFLFLMVSLLPFVSGFAITSKHPHPSFLRLADDTNQETPKQGSVGTFGDWEELHGNYILRPSVSQGPPRALLHFLGGALVGAAPHVSYRYVLEKLANEGYLVVATPYQLSFDHVSTCDVVIERFERIAPMLARQYGAVPVVGVGHSCGALLQLLITSLFPDTPRAANCLISFNNKPVTEAVPFFEELFAPLFTALSAKNGTFPSSTEILSLGLELARATTEGKLPSDDLLQRIARAQAIGPLQKLVPEELIIPGAVRDAFATLTSPSTTALSSAGVLPYMNQIVGTLQQIPLLIEEVAGGARDFCPPPQMVREAARRSYRARRTLILQYDNDSLDESDEIEDLLREAERVTRMKRPMIRIDVQRTTLSGGHATPLFAPPLDLAIRAQDILGNEAAKERLLYKEADATVDELVRWLEEGNL